MWKQIRQIGCCLQFDWVLFHGAGCQDCGSGATFVAQVLLARYCLRCCFCGCPLL